MLGVSPVVVALCIPIVAGMWAVFAKAGLPGWAAIVPFANIYVLLKLVGRPTWWLVPMAIPGVNAVFLIIVMLDLARSFGKGTAFGVFGLAIFSFVGLPVLGFGDARYVGPRGDADLYYPQRSAYGY
jgi:hypothetical protein